MTWNIYAYNVPLSKKLLVLGDQSTHREGFIIERKTKSNSLFSEISPLPSFHKITLQECFNECIEYIEQNQYPEHPINQFAFNCLESQKYSAHQIPCNGLSTLERAINQDHIENFQTVKFKIARNDIDLDIQLLKSWHQRNKKKNIRLDGNRSWTKEQLVYFFEQVSTLPIQYIEDPLKNPNHYAQISHIPIALDESLVDCPEMLKSPCVTHLIIKPTLHSKNNLAKFAKTGLPLIFSSTFETSLGLWHIAQLSQKYSSKETHGLATLNWLLDDPSLDSLKMQTDHLLINDHPPTPRINQMKLVFSL
jgi:O-succinylbenzoate synthase